MYVGSNYFNSNLITITMLALTSKFISNCNFVNSKVNCSKLMIHCCHAITILITLYIVPVNGKLATWPKLIFSDHWSFISDALKTAASAIGAALENLESGMKFYWFIKLEPHLGMFRSTKILFISYLFRTLSIWSITNSYYWDDMSKGERQNQNLGISNNWGGPLSIQCMYVLKLLGDHKI